MTLFSCKACAYETSHSGSYKKHLATRKHKVRCGDTQLTDTHKRDKKNSQNITSCDQKYNQNITSSSQNITSSNNTPVSPNNTPDSKSRNITDIVNAPDNEDATLDQKIIDLTNIVYKMKKEKIEKDKKIEEYEKEKEEQKLVCKYCSQKFKHIVSKYRHITQLRCNKIPEDIQDQIKNKYKNKRIHNMTINKGNSTTNTNHSYNHNHSHNTNNNNINVTNNTTLNSYNCDSYEHITDDEVIRVAISLANGLEKYTLCKLRDPDNKNVYISNVNSPKVLVFVKPKWIYKEKVDVFDYKSSKDLERIRTSYETIRDRTDPKDFEKMISITSQQNFDKFMHQYDHAYDHIGGKRADTKEAKRFRNMKLRVSENAYLSIRDETKELYDNSKKKKL